MTTRTFSWLTPVFRLLRPFQVLALAGCIAAVIPPPARAAEEAARDFDVPAGDAVATLRQAAQQGGFEIVFPTEAVRGVTTRAVRGRFTPNEALNRMVAGTDLYIVQDSTSGAYSVQRAPAASPPAAERKQAAAGQDNDGLIQLSAFEVAENRTRGYLATSSTSATRLNTPIVELSKSIQVITRDMIDDLKVTELNQAMYMSAAVSFTSPYSGRLAVRGFENAAAKRNGLGNYGSDETITDTATIERIEVVKGPSSLLYGSSSPGGVVNYETKKPLSYQQDSARLLVGSFERYRAELDSGGPLIGNGNVLNYRFVAAYDENNNFGKFNGGHRSVAAGSVRWYLTPETYLMVGAEFDNSLRTNIRPGVFPTTRGKFDANGNFISYHDHFEITKDARDNWVGAWSDPYNRHHSRVQRYDVDFSHKFNDSFNLFAHYNYIDNNLDEAYAISSAEGWHATAFATPGRNEINSQQYFRNPHRKSENGTVTLNYDLKRDRFELQVIGGWEYYKFKLLQGDNTALPSQWKLINFVTDQGLYTPWPNTYHGVMDAIGRGEWEILDRYHRTQQYDAPYVLLHSYWLDRRLRVIAGLRRDSIKIKQTYYNKDTTSADPFQLTAPTYSNSDASATTPMVGVSFSPLKSQPGFALFANYSESLVANEIVNPDGSGLPPERGEGLEIGTKLDLNNRLSMTLSWFTIDRTNLARGIPNTVPQAWEASGLQRSRGIDLDLFYAVTPDWQLVGSAAWMNARFINDGDANLIGTRIGGVPAWSWSLWSKYTLPSGALKGFSFGGGVVSRASTQVYGANYPGLVAPEFTRFDLLFGYTTKFNRRDLEYSLKINNVFDEVYLDGVNGWGQPLSYEASITMRF